MSPKRGVEMIFSLFRLTCVCVILFIIAFGSAKTNAAPVNIVYINGINTTRGAALLDRNNIRDRLRNSPSYTESSKREFSVSLIHNPIGWFNVKNDASGPQDRSELFLLKTAEECFASDFTRILVPHNQPRPIDREAAARVSAYLDNIIPGPKGNHDCGANALSDGDRVTASNMAPTKDAAIALADKVQELGSSIVVAHSQGNLLAHLAYARIASLRGDETNRIVRILNVANTSLLSANSLNMTHASDEAVALLILLGQGTTRTTPYCPNEHCNFGVALPSLNGVDVPGDGDNHGLVQSYLSNSSVTVRSAPGVSFTNGAESFQDRFVDFVYAAVKSLDLANPAPPIYLRFEQGDPQGPSDGRVVVRSCGSNFAGGCYKPFVPVKFADWPNGITLSLFSGTMTEIKSNVLQIDNGLEPGDPCFNRVGTSAGITGSVVFGSATGVFLNYPASRYQSLADFFELVRLNNGLTQCPATQASNLRIVDFWPQNPNALIESIDAIAIGGGMNNLPR